MTPGIKPWSRYLQQAYEYVSTTLPDEQSLVSDYSRTNPLLSHLKPGGYIELHEVMLPTQCTEDTSDPKPYFVQWGEGLVEAGAKAGFEFQAPVKLDKMLQNAGFTNITLNWKKW